MKKKAILFWVIFFSLTCSIPAREIGKELRKKGIHVACLSGEDKINLQINKLEQAIRQQNIGLILEIVSPDYLENNSVFDKDRLRENLERSFSNFSKNRGFSTQVNEKIGWAVTATQDFYILNPRMQINEDKAKVVCEAGFFISSNHVTKETLTFSEVGSSWFLTESEHLFSFIEDVSMESQERGAFAEVLGNSPILTLSAEDFTSTHMLVPTILYNYNRTPIPRMNMTTSYEWFGGSIFCTPFGIVSDIEICEGGPDFNHEYLFISDFMGDDIVGSDQDEMLANFGEFGSGVGQFAGPHGMCTVEGYYYFVADMFNNRVVGYVYYNQLDEPEFYTYLTFTSYFNHPVDVEAKDRNPYDGQDITYLAVADEDNHRIVLFHWDPYQLGFDRAYGEYGSGEGQFMWPTSVCFGRDPETGWFTNDIFVTDYGNRRLVRLYIGPEGIIWRSSYQFPVGTELTSVEVDNQGLVYVVDRHNGKVYKFAPSQGGAPYYFSLLGVWGEKGTADGQLYYPDMLQVAHGRYVPYPNPWIPLPTPPGDVFVTESWGDETGVRRFVIAADVLNLSAEWVPYNEDTGEGNFIWWEYSLTDFATVTEQVLLGAEICTTYNEGGLNWGSQAGSWPVDGHPHGTYYTVKITATSIYDPAIVVEKSVDVYVDTLTIHNPIITRGFRCKHDSPFSFWCDDCYQCIKEGRWYTIDVQAYDPDGDPLTYEWSCGFGYFDDGTALYKEITTFENYVCYLAPIFGKNENESAQSSESFTSTLSKPLFADRPDFIQVTVSDPYGGEDNISKYFMVYDESTTCLCGDVNDDGIVNLGDATYLSVYLFRGGAEPVAPIERADANNDCVIDVGDMVFLTSYLYRFGPPPECCWLHE